MAENWADEWTLEQQDREARQKQAIEDQYRQAEERSQQKQKQQAKKEAQEAFIAKALDVPMEIKKKLWEQARKQLKENPDIPAAAQKMHTRLKYKEYLLEYFIEQGEEFDGKSLESLDVATKVAQDFSSL